MSKRGFVVGISIACMALAACGESGEYGESADYPEADAAIEAAPEALFEEGEPMAESASSDQLAETIAARPDIPLILPRMAYVYDYGFQTEAAQIASLQERHADMC